ncbi:ubiquitin carboxyl-terminal hydrolase, partial [Trifolium medium]|nr:ubiquitin carboxyl-terminal hydrolase [Trifolium medium]
ASGSAANTVDINESGSGKVGESESEGAICLQDRLKWLDKPVVRKHRDLNFLSLEMGVGGGRLDMELQ